MTPTVEQLCHPDDCPPELTDRLVDCWVEVTNAGGAAGFPFPPVTADDVAPRLHDLRARLDPDSRRLLVAPGAGDVLGWLLLVRDPFRLVAHWGEVRHLQTRPAVRGRGLGVALMREAQRVARDEMALEQLRLTARDGLGLDAFYGRLGWQVVGRWPRALRLADGDRDEVLMALDPL